MGNRASAERTMVDDTMIAYPVSPYCGEPTCGRDMQVGDYAALLFRDRRPSAACKRHSATIPSLVGVLGTVRTADGTRYYCIEAAAGV